MNGFMQSTDGVRLVKFLVGLVAIAMVFLVAKTLNEFKTGAYIGRDVAAQNTITVSGEGEIFAKPDIATFTFSVTEEGKTVADAQKAATDKSNKAIDFLVKSGINKDKDVKTTSYNINPKYEYYTQPQIMMPCSVDYCPPRPVQNPKIIGYEVSQSIEVKVHDLAKAGDLLTGMGAVGVQNISSLSFSIENEDVVKDQARDKAITQARDKAKTLAKELGVSLVRVTNFSENGNYPIYYAKTMAMDSVSGSGVATPAPEVPSGENRIVSDVTIVYEIR